MKLLKYLIVFVVTSSTIFISCSTVPLTGRSQLNMIPNNEMLAMSFQQYDLFLKENPPSNNQAQVKMVRDVGTRIQYAVEKYMADNNMSDRLEGYD